MDAEKSKKLQQYALALNEQAVGEEKSGKVQEAAKHYLKLVDVFLVLAAEAQDHNTWQQYIHQAETYQNKARSVIPKDQQVIPTPAMRQVPPPMPQRNDVVQNRLNPIKKIIRPFQKSEELLPDQPAEETTQSQSEVKTPLSVPLDSIPAELYQRTVAENKLLREKVSSITKETEERILVLQKENGELQNRISEMVPRVDYEVLQTEFTNMVPRAEYDRVRAQFLNMVPKEHYDELLNRISQMVPKQDYLDAERRVLQLEDAARNSVPKKLIDDLANEISMLGVLSEVPIVSEEEQKESSSELII